MSHRLIRDIVTTAAALLAAIGAAGCGSGGKGTYRVQGQIQLAAGDNRLLAGHSLEAALESDPHVRTYGVIDADGHFVLESLLDGVIRQGALPGRYRARLALSDDDPELRRQALESIPKRFLQFETSGLTLEVPAAAPITLAVPKS